MFDFDLFTKNKIEKTKFLNEHLLSLHKHHVKHCPPYAKYISATQHAIQNYTDIPPISVRLFKEIDLLSVPQEEIHKTLKSSGTTGQIPSKIFIDKQTSQLQTKALVKIMQSVLGKERLPMLIIDTKSTLKNTSSFTARGAGILGFSNFGRDHTYALNDDLSINYELLEDFLKKYDNQSVFIFGFTFIVWKYFLKELKKNNKSFNFSNSILLHGGGWKKLTDEAVTAEELASVCHSTLGKVRPVNYYGLVEQVGSIYPECTHGYLHASEFSDILIKDIYTGETLPYGEAGVVQLFSIIPYSYPGISLITEDMGTVYGEDTCSCGQKGKYFKIHGRIPKVEVRGCSDTVS